MVTEIRINEGVKVPARAMVVIRELMTLCGLESLTITSTDRTPARQAKAMYDNCVKLGPKHELGLYLAPGQAVVRTFMSWAGRGANEHEILAAMEMEILKQGPQRVSNHCAPADYPAIIVDISPNSILPKLFDRLVDLCRRHPDISKVLAPPQDRALHLEILKAPVIS